MTAVTVSPAAVDPTPVVSTDLGIIFEANLNIWDLPVPGSPTSNRWDSERTLTPVSKLAFWLLPPAKTTATANFTRKREYN